MAGSSFRSILAVLALSVAASVTTTVTVTYQRTVASWVETFESLRSLVLDAIDGVASAFKRVVARFAQARLALQPTASQVAMRDYTHRQDHTAPVIRATESNRWSMCPST